MNVRDLITQLAECDPDLQVRVTCYCPSCDEDSVEPDEYIITGASNVFQGTLYLDTELD